MTPQELALVLTTGQTISSDPDGFSSAFYDTVFAIAPAARSLFPDDMADQKKKLMRELSFMLGAAAALTDPDELDAFITRTEALGRRHVGYGVTAAMYEPVATALIMTLRERAAGFGDAHEQAWTKLLGFVAETMLAGAAKMTAPPAAQAYATASASPIMRPAQNDRSSCMQCATTIRVETA